MNSPTCISCGGGWEVHTRRCVVCGDLFWIDDRCYLTRARCAICWEAKKVIDYVKAQGKNQLDRIADVHYGIFRKPGESDGELMARLRGIYGSHGKIDWSKVE